MLAGGKSFDRQGTDLDANEPFDFVPQPVKHFANLALESLGQDYLQTARSNAENLFHPREAFLDGKAFLHLRREGEVEFAVERDDVGLPHFRRGMRQALGEIAVVGDDEQALGFLVEAADVHDSRPARGQEIVDGAFGGRLGRGAEIAGRLVQDRHEGKRHFDRLAVDDHPVVGVDARGQFAQPVTVDRDGAFEDQLFTGAPRTETGAGKILV